MLRNFTILFSIFLLVPFCFCETIAKVESFKGYVIVKSGKKIFRLKSKNQSLNNGDFIQAKKGYAKILFNDGARMTVRPFSSTRIGNKVEKGKKTRRVTCFAGKVWFKSGKKSKVKNYLQTPNMVCGLRGTEVEIGAFPKKKEIGSITQVKGRVVLQSGKKILRVMNKGVLVYADDRIQTKRGKAIITLNDGAVIKVRPFSRIRIQEKKNEGKTKRRVTCFSGKLWMKSGFNKKIKNYVQTPNMVCGLRGTVVEIAAVPTKPQVGRIARVKGFVIVRSGRKIERIKKSGKILYAGDHVQTKRGQVQVQFADGGLLKIRPFTSTLIQQKKPAHSQKKERRITCFTGKLWFKSGKKSKVKNYLQTPNMVCGLRGTVVETAFDAQSNQSGVTTHEGDTDITGNHTDAQIMNPGESSAFASNVFSGYNTAFEQQSFNNIQSAINNTIDSLSLNPSSEATSSVSTDMSNVDTQNHESFMNFEEGSFDELDGQPQEGTVPDSLIEQSNDNSIAGSGDATSSFQSDAALMEDNPNSQVSDSAGQEVTQEPQNIVNSGSVAVTEGNIDPEGSYDVVASVPESSPDTLDQSGVGSMLNLADENPEFADAMGDMIDQTADSSTNQSSLTQESSGDGDGDGGGDGGDGGDGDGKGGDGDGKGGDGGKGANGSRGNSGGGRGVGGGGYGGGGGGGASAAFDNFASGARESDFTNENGNSGGQ